MELLTIKPELDILSIEEELELLDKLLDAEKNSIKSTNRTILRYGNSVYGNVKSDLIPNYLLNLSNKLIDKKILDTFPEDITIKTDGINLSKYASALGGAILPTSTLKTNRSGALTNRYITILSSIKESCL